MRYWIILLFTFCSLWSLADGPVNIGIKYGTNSSVMMTNFDMVLNQNLQSDQINNHFAGAFLRLNAGSVYAQPEVYFNTKEVSLNRLTLPRYQYPRLQLLTTNRLTYPYC
ncbi:MAG TPA: hypothetical protein PLS94_10485 [Prolixibacteraceae bacterium]|nr:hypothetical protein [Prolixibacteraceae bacterium]